MKRVVIGIIGAGLITCMPGDLSAARAGKVFGSYINVRTEPSHASTVVAKKLRGDSYTISFEDKGWLKVDFADGTKGWIFNSVIEKQLAKEESKTPKPASVASESAPVAPKKDLYEIPYIDRSAEAKKESKEEKTLVKSGEKETSATDDKDADATASGTALLKKEKEEEKAKEKEKQIKKEKEKAREKEKAKEKELAKEKEKAKETSEKPAGEAGKADAPKQDPKKAEELSPAKAVSTSKTASEYYHEAIELYEKKRYQESLEANRAALQQAPRNAEILNNMGNCLFKMGKIQDAVSNWKEALKAAPKQAKICNNLGIAYYQLDENDRAIEFYKKAILFEPQFADAYYNLASVYGFKGQFRDALENYRKYLEFNPDATMKKLTEERIDYCQKQLNTGKKDSK